MSERVLIENVKPGMVISRITQQNGPVSIQKSGLVSSDSMVQGLAEMGVLEVEIDPDLTVQLAPKVSYQTQTQALLRGQHDTAAKAVSSMDNAVSDQFNRSLFLPTVQSMPSVWQQYTKNAALYLFIVVGGLAMGFSVGSAERWWPALTASFSEAQPAKTASADNVVEQPAKDAEQTDPLSTDTQKDKPASPSATTTAARQKGTESALPQTQQSDMGQSEERPAAPITKSEPAYEGKVLNEPAEKNVDVSPELMARFNEAVKALDTEKQTQAPPPKSKVNVHSDVPRVDQLPVRLLTRLPSMNFSAHMYASNPQDRWVRVNGKQLGEGDWITDRVQIVNIEGQRVILNFEDELFSMAALTDW
ncbi:general secretion pathway protein GspB [Alteromonas ponticola]|uniref:GspB domain-containing protein n=1 Tax=Alteromonas ponticola TaxID=2720613 RepID=A0ABX1R2D4_9ALTE|nr:general secretion pathway protein GspB [Alteromonas ponticola]NMH59335.1 GspB domain-containing protein [Alteromonas ponticola]